MAKITTNKNEVVFIWKGDKVMSVSRYHAYHSYLHIDGVAFQNKMKRITGKEKALAMFNGWPPYDDVIVMDSFFFAERPGMQWYVYQIYMDDRGATKENILARDLSYDNAKIAANVLTEYFTGPIITVAQEIKDERVRRLKETLGRLSEISDTLFKIEISSKRLEVIQLSLEALERDILEELGGDK